MESLTGVKNGQSLTESGEKERGQQPRRKGGGKPMGCGRIEDRKQANFKEGGNREK